MGGVYIICSLNDHWKYVYDSSCSNIWNNGQHICWFKFTDDDFHFDDFDNNVHPLQFPLKLRSWLIWIEVRDVCWNDSPCDWSLALKFSRQSRYWCYVVDLCPDTWRAILNFHFKHSFKSSDNLVSNTGKGKSNSDHDSLCSSWRYDWICHAYSFC